MFTRGIKRRRRQAKPMVMVFGGPNGSGKSTITEAYRNGGLLPTKYINADEIAIETGLEGYGPTIEADARRREALARRESFAFETVMSVRDKIDFMAEANQAGYHVHLVFVTTKNPETNVRRVARRAQMGGHSVDLDKIRSRYHRSLGLLPEALAVATTAIVYDNSADDRPAVVVAEKTPKGSIVVNREAGAFWLKWFRDNMVLGSYHME